MNFNALVLSFLVFPIATFYWMVAKPTTIRVLIHITASLTASILSSVWIYRTIILKLLTP